MKLEQYTKTELIQIINKISFLDDFKLRNAIRDIEIQRMNKQYDEINKQAEIATSYLQKYAELLKPYEGKKIADIPVEVVKNANEYYKKYLEAQEKEFELENKYRGEKFG